MIFKLPSPPDYKPGDETKFLIAIRSYLYQMAEQLNHAGNSIDAGNFTDAGLEALSDAVKGSTQNDIAAQGDALKSLIIKTADTVNQTITEVEAKIAESYVATSDFGTYSEQTDAKITANSQGIEQAYDSISLLQANLEAVSADFGAYQVSTSQYIRTGHLYDENGIPRYGVAVGENLTMVEVDGQVVLERKNLVATFTSNELAFWQNNQKVGWFSANRLHVASIQVNGYIDMPDWRIDTKNGFSIKWTGG